MSSQYRRFTSIHFVFALTILAKSGGIPHFSGVSQPYLSLEAELHDPFWASADGGSEIVLMSKFLGNHPGPAVEMGAGSGRLLFPLREMGFEIEGVEFSKDMLAIAEKHGCGGGIHHGDMSTWRDGRIFSSVLAPAFTFQLASDPAACLRHWHSLLVPGGGLYLTVFMPYAELFGDLPENEWYRDHSCDLPDGSHALLETRHRLDRKNRLLHREHRYTISGKTNTSHLSKQTVRWFEHRELIGLLEECGFRHELAFLDFNAANVTDDPENVDFDGILTYHAVAEIIRKPIISAGGPSC